MKALYYGDNLQVLRDSIASESVDLIYLDPPFNSNATYNILFRSPKGDESQAQIEAFEDSWHWTDEAERAFDEVMHSGNTDAADMLRAMRQFLGENDMLAYLTMMAVRLLELHRVLKPTGSLYLHCDPTASHYLKILLDAVFGPTRFLNEAVWKRTSSHNDPQRFGRIGVRKGGGDSTAFRVTRSDRRNKERSGRILDNSVFATDVFHGLPPGLGKRHDNLPHGLAKRRIDSLLNLPQGLAKDHPIPPGLTNRTELPSGLSN